MTVQIASCWCFDEMMSFRSNFNRINAIDSSLIESLATAMFTRTMNTIATLNLNISLVWSHMARSELIAMYDRPSLPFAPSHSGHLGTV